MDVLEDIRRALTKGHRCLVIRGAAGTGKTTLVRGILPHIRAMHFSPVLLAPTGRAAKMLLLRTGMDACTIHSTIYSPPDAPVQDSEGTWCWKFGLKRDVPADSVIIVDEASMVGLAVKKEETLQFGSGSLLKDLVGWSGIKLAGCRNVLIFVGDPFQLPPVGERTDVPPALNPSCLHDVTGCVPCVFDLKDVYRQSDGSGILEEATRLRVKLASKCFGEFQCCEHSDVHLVTEDDLIARYCTHGENLNNKVIVAQTNEQVWRYNGLVRRLLNRLDPLPMLGERLMSLRNTCTVDSDGSEVIFANGDLLQMVEDFGRDFKLEGFYRLPGTTESLHFPIWFRKMTVAWMQDDGRTLATVWVNVSPIVSEEWRANDQYAYLALYAAVYDQLRKRFPNLNKKELAQKAKNSALLHAPIVTFGYAMTVHKAQGAEWDDVWVDYHFSQNQRTEEYFRWAYTATTRAKKNLYALQPPNFDDLLAALGRGIERSAADQSMAVTAKKFETLDAALSAHGFGSGERLLQDWAYRVTILAKDDSDLELGSVRVCFNKQGVVTQIMPRISGMTEDALRDVRTLVGSPVRIVLKLAVTPIETPLVDCRVQHKRVVDRINSAAGDDFQLTAAKSLSDHQLRVSIRTALGDGYVDWYFDGKGRVTEMGNSTVPISALKLLREALQNG